MSVLPPRGDWTQQELWEIDRIRAQCQKQPGFELECSHTDEGDPWCIVYDRQRERIILHIARIDRCYVVVSPRQSKSARASSMADAVETALRDLLTNCPPMRLGRTATGLAELRDFARSQNALQRGCVAALSGPQAHER